MTVPCLSSLRATIRNSRTVRFQAANPTVAKTATVRTQENRTLSLNSVVAKSATTAEASLNYVPLPPVARRIHVFSDKTGMGFAGAGASILLLKESASRAMSDRLAMPLHDAHFGASLAFPLCRSTQRTQHPSAKKVFSSCTTTDSGYTRLNNTRQGYARKRTLKSAGYFFLGRDR